MSQGGHRLGRSTLPMSKAGEYEPQPHHCGTTMAHDPVVWHAAGGSRGVPIAEECRSLLPLWAGLLRLIVWAIRRNLVLPSR